MRGGNGNGGDIPEGKYILSRSDMDRKIVVNEPYFYFIFLM